MLFPASLEGYFWASGFTGGNLRGAGGRNLALGSCVTPAGRSKKGCWKEETCQVQLRCPQVELPSAAGAAAPGPPPDVQLEAAAGGETLLHRHSPATHRHLLSLDFSFCQLFILFFFPQEMIII